MESSLISVRRNFAQILERESRAVPEHKYFDIQIQLLESP